MLCRTVDAVIGHAVHAHGAGMVVVTTGLGERVGAGCALDDEVAVAGSSREPLRREELGREPLVTLFRLSKLRVCLEELLICSLFEYLMIALLFRILLYHYYQRHLLQLY